MRHDTTISLPLFGVALPLPRWTVSAFGVIADPADGLGSGSVRRGAHTGNFSTEYGDRDGCWVKVWRTFADGCRHYQMFNSCGGFWETNGDGSPKVVWTYCVH